MHSLMKTLIKIILYVYSSNTTNTNCIVVILVPGKSCNTLLRGILMPGPSGRVLGSYVKHQ